MIKAKLFSIKPKYLDDKPGEAQETLAENSLANVALGWKPKRNLEDYIQGELYEE